jgi:cobalt transporter subunit CbtA
VLGRILLPAVIVGILAGGLLTAIQQIEVVPLILEAEAYEDGVVAAGAEGRAHNDRTHDHGAGADEAQSWGPENGLERTGYSLLANVVTAAGFGLLLSAAFTLLGAAGRRVDWRKGLLWGLAGFGAVQLAPALGLPPGLPGSAETALEARQTWWILTAALTALGLGLIAFARRPYLRALGIVPIVVPHLVGAPQAEQAAGLVPDELAARYVYASLLTNAVFWLALGALTARLHGLFAARREQPAPA